MQERGTLLARIPYLDHIVDGVERQIKDFDLSKEQLMDLVVRLNDMIADVNYTRVFEEAILKD